MTLIGRLLRLSSSQREAIGEELRDHFESRLTELTSRGIDHLNRNEKQVNRLPDALTVETESKLDQFTVADYQDPIPLDDFLNRFTEKFDVQMYVDQESLKAAGVDPTAVQVQIRLRHVR